MPSLSAYHLTWVCLTLVVGYLFTVGPAKHSPNTTSFNSYQSARRVISLQSVVLLLAVDFTSSSLPSETSFQSSRSDLTLLMPVFSLINTPHKLHASLWAGSTSSTYFASYPLPILSQTLCQWRSQSWNTFIPLLMLCQNLCQWRSQSWDTSVFFFRFQSFPIF